MRRIIKPEQLKKGDEIIHILLNKFVMLRFVCTNIFGYKHSHFLKENGDMTTLDHSTLQNEEWFLVNDTPKFWREAYEKQKALLVEHIDEIDNYINHLKELEVKHEK